LSVCLTCHSCPLIIFLCLFTSFIISIPIPSSYFLSSFFFFNDTATTEIYTLSLHDALPILEEDKITPPLKSVIRLATAEDIKKRSEEHTSELQSRFDLVCRLLLEKKNNIKR